MIGKRAALGGKRGFGGVVRYLLNGSKADPHGPDRVAFRTVRNLAVDDPAKAAQLMRWTAEGNARVQKPVYHLVLSWHRDENPTDEAMIEAADATRTMIDLDEHQAIYVAHNDTEHRHIHIVANRVHPTTRKAWSTSHDYARIEKAVAEHAQQAGFTVIPGRHNSPQGRKDRPRRARTGEYRQRQRTKQPVRQQFAINRLKTLATHLAPEFEAATSWTDLSTRLLGHRLRLESKGQGLVITDGLNEMKLSHLGRQIRLKTLQERFGQSWASFDKEKPQPNPDREQRPGQRRTQTAPPRNPQATLSPQALRAQDLAEAIAANRRSANLASAQPPNLIEAIQAFTDPEPETPTRPVVSKRDLAYAFYNLGLITEQQLKDSLDAIALDEEHASRRPRSAFDAPLLPKAKDKDRDR